jgi:hypothetical protein
VLEIVATSDPAKPFALTRRHRGLDGRMRSTTLSTWPTKNAAFDSYYDTVAGINCGPGYTVPSEPIVIEERLKPRDHITVSIVALTVAAIAIGALGMWYGSSASAMEAATSPYTITLDRN